MIWTALLQEAIIVAMRELLRSILELVRRRYWDFCVVCLPVLTMLITLMIGPLFVLVPLMVVALAALLRWVHRENEPPR